MLSAAGFTGNIERSFGERLEANLGRPINPRLANLGRLLWFDKLHSLNHDNTCGGCHSPAIGLAIRNPWPSESKQQPWAAPRRPRNQQHSPLVVDTAMSRRWCGMAVQLVVWQSVDRSTGLPFSVSRRRHSFFQCQRCTAPCDAPFAGTGAHASDGAYRGRRRSPGHVPPESPTRHWEVRFASLTMVGAKLGASAG